MTLSLSRVTRKITSFWSHFLFRKLQTLWVQRVFFFMFTVLMFTFDSSFSTRHWIVLIVVVCFKIRLLYISKTDIFRNIIFFFRISNEIFQIRFCKIDDKILRLFKFDRFQKLVSNHILCCKNRIFTIEITDSQILLDVSTSLIKFEKTMSTSIWKNLQRVFRRSLENFLIRIEIVWNESNVWYLKVENVFSDFSFLSCRLCHVIFCFSFIVTYLLFILCIVSLHHHNKLKTITRNFFRTDAWTYDMFLFDFSFHFHEKCHSTRYDLQLTR